MAEAPLGAPSSPGRAARGEEGVAVGIRPHWVPKTGLAWQKMAEPNPATSLPPPKKHPRGKENEGKGQRSKGNGGFTSVLGWVGVEDAAGSPGSEVVAGDGLAVTPVQHQLVAVFLGLVVVFLGLEAENAVRSGRLCASPQVTA